MAYGMLAVFVAIALAATALIIYFVIIYNGLVTIKNNVEKAWSNIDVLLKQRYDELPKLVAVCERYMRHEAETLEKVIKARNIMAGANTMTERGKAEGMLTEALKSLFAVSENYPELKADKRFGQLQSRVTELENEISDRRELFNESVNIHNIRIEKIPDAMVANFLGYKKKDLWQINPDERKDAGIKFSH
ncbi:MAG TPA: LemA family protein [Thermodesulfobacteriota bacterium]|nr:LemA family protein [Thermodesulfobacteriota bacterium]